MGDSLTRLVQRTLGMAPVVRPVIAPLYAPGPVMAGGGPSVSDEALFSPADSEKPRGSDEQLEPGLSASEYHSRDTLQRQPESRAKKTPVMAPPEARKTRREGKHSAVFAAPDNPSPVLTPSGPEQQIPTSMKGIEASLPAPEEHPSFSLPLHPEVPAQAPLPVPPQGERSELMGTCEAAQKQEGSQALSAAHEDSLSSSPAEFPGQQILRPRVVLPEERPPNAVEAPMKGDLRRRSPESATAAPTIRVTIGRVEVRANLPPTPASRSKPARPGPMLSLDDYLKRRDRGH